MLSGTPRSSARRFISAIKAIIGTPGAMRVIRALGPPRSTIDLCYTAMCVAAGYTSSPFLLVLVAEFPSSGRWSAGESENKALLGFVS